jgi:hypothetical protein
MNSRRVPLVASTVILLVAGGLAAACGPRTGGSGTSGEPAPAAGQPEAPAAGQPGTPAAGQPGPTRRRYSWTLPIGDVSPNENEKRVYDLVRHGDCAGAQGELDENWTRFESPRNVLLAQAGIHFCRDDLTAGTAMFRRAERYGWAGLLHDGDNTPRAACEYYRSGASVLNQKPRSGFACPRGEPPQWTEPEPERSTDPRRGGK